MDAVVRLKRRLEDNQADALVLKCKKIKLDDSEYNSTILTYAGTVSNEQEFYQQINKIQKERFNKGSKTFTPSTAEKNRAQTKIDSKESRYKVTNCFRALDKESTSEDDNVLTADCTVIDVECEIAEQKSEESFVYDIFYANQIKGDLELELVDSIQLFDEVFDQENDESENDSDDSNAENNWRNDYPDSDLDDEFIEGMDNCHLSGKDVVSSDDEDLLDADYNSKFAYYHDELEKNVDDSDESNEWTD